MSACCSAWTVDAFSRELTRDSGGAFTEYNTDNQLVVATDTGGMTYRFYKVIIDNWMD